MFSKVDLERNTFSLAMDNTIGFAASGVKKYRKGDEKTGPLVVENLPVFRSGSFRNSWGELTTWSDLHIQQMISNFQFLKSSGIFADVPVRSAHPEPWFRNSTLEVIGYITDLRSEKRNHPGTGAEYSYLLSNFEVTNPAAAEMIENGTFRNRSAEVGMYVDNDEAEYYPVLLGFAYVDIPAVEGLNFGKRAQVRRYAIDEEGSNVPDDVVVNTESEVTEDEVTEPEVTEPEVTEPEVTEDEVTEDEVTEDEVTEDEVTEPEVTEPPQVMYTADQPVSITFNGNTITDPKIVQSIIDNLAGAVVQSRNAYVKSMFEKNQIVASQKDRLEGFVSKLSEDQWADFRGIFDDSPAIPTLDFNHQEPETAGENHEVEVLSQVVLHLRKALGDEKAKKTDAYQKLEKMMEGTTNA